MLTRRSEQLGIALESLPPDERALLELSLRHGVPDDELAALLRVERGHVQRRREMALGRLAGTLDEADGRSAGGNGARIEALVPGAPRRRARRRPRRRRAAVAAVAMLVAAAAAVAVVTSGDEESPRRADEPAPPPASEAGQRVSLRPVAGAPAAPASARLVGEGEDARLRLRVGGLPEPDGFYTVWLYDSVTDAVPLARLRASRGELDVALPEGFARYRLIDVSREPADGNPNHSGASVLRAPVSRLAAGR